MRIVYVGNFDRLSVGEPEVAECLENLGHTVVKLHEQTANVRMVEDACKDADLLLYAKCRVGHDYELRRLFETISIPRVQWIWDLYWGL